MLKIVLLAYSHGLISSRKIGQTCTHNVLFIALSGDSQPSYTHIARFVRDLGPDIQVLFSQVLLSASSARPCSPSTAVRLPANPKKSAAAPTPSWHITAAKCRRTS